MQPAWESWRELVAREREEEDDYAGREEGLMAFASVVTRVGRRRDRDRRVRAFAAWRLEAARSAVTVARQEVQRGTEVARAIEVENVSCVFHGWGGRGWGTSLAGGTRGVAIRQVSSQGRRSKHKVKLSTD